MQFMRKREYLNRGDVAVVDCSHRCNIRLISDLDFQSYRRGGSHHYHGGHYDRLPARIVVPDHQQHGIFDGASALGWMLQRLAAVRDLPPRVADLGGTLRALDAAAHGMDVPADAATAALEAGTQLLDAFRRLLEDQ